MFQLPCHHVLFAQTENLWNSCDIWYLSHLRHSSSSIIKAQYVLLSLRVIHAFRVLRKVVLVKGSLIWSICTNLTFNLTFEIPAIFYRLCFFAFPSLLQRDKLASVDGEWRIKTAAFKTKTSRQTNTASLSSQLWLNKASDRAGESLHESLCGNRKPPRSTCLQLLCQ